MRRLQALSRALRPPYRRTAPLSTRRTPARGTTRHTRSPEVGTRGGCRGVPHCIPSSGRGNHVPGLVPVVATQHPTSFPVRARRARSRGARRGATSPGGAAHHRAPVSAFGGGCTADVRARARPRSGPRKRHCATELGRHWRQGDRVSRMFGGSLSLSRKGAGAGGAKQATARPRLSTRTPWSRSAGRRTGLRARRWSRASPRGCAAQRTTALPVSRGSRAPAQRPGETM